MKSDGSAAGGSDLRGKKDEEDIMRFGGIGEITTYAIRLGFNPTFHQNLESFFLSEHMNMIDMGEEGYSLEPE